MSETLGGDQVKKQRIRTVKCSSWDDFISKIRAPYFAGTRIFRGHSDSSWKLSSVWERILTRRCDEAVNIDEHAVNFDQNLRERDGFLNRFKQHAVGLPGLDSGKVKTERDWWTVARHYGLVSPLLDWTMSPYVAAFFAFMVFVEKCNPGFCSGLTDKSLSLDAGTIAIWELFIEDWPADGDLPASIQVQGEFEVFDSRVDFAFRQKAQQGLFTWLTHPEHFDLESYLVSRGLEELLCKYELSGQEAECSFPDLVDMNISYATLFPDLEGAAKQANIWHSYCALLPSAGDCEHSWPLKSSQ